MQRDGYNKSIWQDTAPAPADQSGIPVNCDTIIAGAGITGLSLALELQQAGQKVVILEAHSIGFGTTSGTTAHLNTVFDNPYKQMISDFGKEHSAKVARLSEQAISLIEKNISTYEIECGFERVTGYVFAADESQEKIVDDMYEGTKEVNVAIEYTDKIPVAIPFTKAVEIPGQAKFNPADYICGLAKAFRAAGGMIMENCVVSNVEEKDDAVYVTGENAAITCKHFVWATHTTPGINLLSFRLAPYRSYVIAAPLSDKSAEFSGLVYDAADPYHYLRMQEVNGINYLIAGGEDHKTAHEENTEIPFRKLEAYVRKYFSITEPIRKWSSQFYEPADGLAYIGLMPTGERVYTATGYGGNGMIYSCIAAIVLRDMIIGEDSPYKDLFSPSRLKPVAGFTNFVKENADVVKEMVTGWFSQEKIHELSDMAAGEGKIVKYDGHKMGLYKDDNGGVHAVSATCKHAGCTIGWNPSEKSWDCPCHGARYDIDGTMITGPATSSLKPIDVRD